MADLGLIIDIMSHYEQRTGIPTIDTIGTYQQLSSLVLHLAASFPFEIQMCSLFADPCLAEPPQAAECLVADPLAALALFAAVFVVVPSAEMNNTYANLFPFQFNKIIRVSSA